ncbi:MAG TPA: tetratricopeptide repeat protein [Gemmatimonadales bacterium]|nr:tetratricopeptide repeat protein [Gemmatimonadales bacterium]
MAYTSEIEKLEARFNDNPKGRNFAPLADAYRKAGLIDNAIVLCQNGLQLHPDYVSAHIVYARCLVDKKDDPAALGVFKKVLELDGQNIIALRGLAELAERNGNYAEEVQWLSQLLNADPMNGDAAEALARAKGKLATKPVDVSEAPTAAMDKPDFAVEHETPEVVELKRDSSAATAAPEVENFESPISFNPNAHQAAKADGLEVQEDVELNSQQIEQVEIEGLARTQYEGSGMFKLDAPEPAAAGAGPDLDEALPQVDLPLIMPDDEVAPPRAAAPPPPLAPPPAPPPPAPPRVSIPAIALSDDDGAADTATLSKAEPVVTETMAELYLKQGHTQDALRVYQALLAQRPNDAKLKGKVEQLSSGGRKGSGISAQTFLKNIWSGRRPTPVAAAQPEEQTTLEAAFDVAGPPPPPPGQPSHPAQDHISLDSVFGEEAARASTAVPSAAPEPPPGPGAPPAPDASKTGGFSFDEFFAGGKAGAAAGGAGAGGAPADATAAKTPGGSRTSGRTQRPPEDDAEADQFQQWLKKLKS